MQYHIDISGDEHNDFRTSFAKAIAIAIENGTDEVVIAINDIEELDSLIHPVILGIASKLKKFGSTKIGDVNLYLEIQDKPSAFNSGIIVAAYLTEENLEKTLIDPRATDTIFVTNNLNTLNNYLSKNKSVALNNDL